MISSGTCSIDQQRFTFLVSVRQNVIWKFSTMARNIIMMTKILSSNDYDIVYVVFMLICGNKMSKKLAILTEKVPKQQQQKRKKVILFDIKCF